MHTLPMDTAPAKIPGAVLAAERDTYGVSRTDLARKLRLHRNTLRDWEKALEVDVIKAARYRNALREFVDEAIGESVA